VGGAADALLAPRELREVSHATPRHRMRLWVDTAKLPGLGDSLVFDGMEGAQDYGGGKGLSACQNHAVA
jgi:hypothetical protein